MPKVKMYTTSTCVYCRAEKEFLKEHNIAFEEVPVDVDAKAAEEMIQLSGQMGVPFTVITPDEIGARPVHILGFDQHRLSHALGIA
jgi:glutaredoxin